MDYSIFSPDTLMTSQWADLHRRTGEGSGEAILWLAILEDAIDCYLGRGSFGSGHYHPAAVSKRKRHEAAKCWFGLCDGADHCDPGAASITFAAICDLFDFEADDIRHALLTRGREIKFERHMRVTAGRAMVVESRRDRDHERHEKRARESGVLRREYTRAEA